jgi:hypothetical protein
MKMKMGMGMESPAEGAGMMTRPAARSAALHVWTA